MKLIEIENIKAVTNAIFVGELFDNFLLVEASIDVLSSFTIDGHINKNFLTDEEKEEACYKENYVEWKRVKSYCFDIIKGKKLPVSMKLIFKLADSKVPAFLKSSKLEGIDPQVINGLFMNIKYENGKMDCITGTSLSTFNIGDRTAEEAWDAMVAKFINSII